MDAAQLQKYQDIALNYVTDFGVKILAALAFWFIGRWLIGIAIRMIEASMTTQKIDATIMRYIGSIMGVILNVLLILGILGYFGFQTTTFAAIFAAAGVAIGMAWSGLLSNFAAGAFIIVLRPYKVGDFITAAGVTGTVREIGLFTTTIDTMDNIMTMVGNNKIFSDNIQNFSANPFRRVDLKCQLAGNADHNAAMKLLREKVKSIPNVLLNPAVDVEIAEFTLVGPVLVVRPYCHNDHYWQVYFDTNRMIREALAAAGFPDPMPAQTVLVHQQ